MESWWRAGDKSLHCSDIPTPSTMSLSKGGLARGKGYRGARVTSCVWGGVAGQATPACNCNLSGLPICPVPPFCTQVCQPSFCKDSAHGDYQGAPFQMQRQSVAPLKRVCVALHHQRRQQKQICIVSCISIRDGNRIKCLSDIFAKIITWGITSILAHIKLIPNESDCMILYIIWVKYRLILKLFIAN